MFTSDVIKARNVHVERYVERNVHVDLSQIFTRRRFLHAQWEKRYRHVRIALFS